MFRLKMLVRRGISLNNFLYKVIKLNMQADILFTVKNLLKIAVFHIYKCKIIYCGVDYCVPKYHKYFWNIFVRNIICRHL
jgi:hypothetical protein